MINRLILILTCIYFLAGNILLPQGDFSAIAQMRGMYQHCKTTEDPEMDLTDFITEHLLNLDSIFNGKEDADEHELPHNPIPFHTNTANVFYFVNADAIITQQEALSVVLNQPDYHSPYFSRLNTHKIFQPPRA